MAVDKIAIRKQIVNNNYTNLNIKALFDTRIRLTDAQGFGVVWDEEKQKKQFLNTMNFTDEEAEADTPVSACNIALSVAPTVRLICTYIVADFINLLQNNGDFKQMILLQHAFKFEAEAF